MNSYALGNQVIVTGTFTNMAREPADATTVTLRMVDPKGNEQVVPTGALTHVATGVYSYPIIVQVPDVCRYRFEGTGACVDAQDGLFTVESSPFAVGSDGNVGLAPGGALLRLVVSQ